MAAAGGGAAEAGKSREYDVVVFGATGFTGQSVSQSVDWGMGAMGRSIDQPIDRLTNPTHPPTNP